MTVPAREVVDVLERMAPRALAADWDNVGWLLEGDRDVERIGLCIDLTESVAVELGFYKVDFVVAYHPPIFGSLTRLTRATPRGRVLLDLVRAGVHVYSPHTALDAAPDGMTDWLVAAAGAVVDVAPITPDRARPDAGAGRRARLVAPCTVAAAVASIQAHLGVDVVRVAGDPTHTIRTIAACPGAGSSVLERVDADLVLTGEMRHHDVLRHVGEGRVVVLSEHTHTERGFLPILAERLRRGFPPLEVVVPAIDADPLVPWVRSVDAPG